MKGKQILFADYWRDIGLRRGQGLIIIGTIEKDRIHPKNLDKFVQVLLRR